MSLAPVSGRVAHVFGDDYDVDQIVGVGNIKIQDIERLVELASANLGEAFRGRVRPGDVLVAGANFGYGHPHFPAMRAMRRLGIRAVVAESFFPVYWRGEISNGFPQVPCVGITALVQPGDPIEIDLVRNRVRLPAYSRELDFPPYSRSELAVLQAGGFRAWLGRSIGAERDNEESRR